MVMLLAPLLAYICSYCLGISFFATHQVAAACCNCQCGSISASKTAAAEPGENPTWQGVGRGAAPAGAGRSSTQTLYLRVRPFSRTHCVHPTRLKLLKRPINAPHPDLREHRLAHSTPQRMDAPGPDSKIVLNKQVNRCGFGEECGPSCWLWRSGRRRPLSADSTHTRLRAAPRRPRIMPRIDHQLLYRSRIRCSSPPPSPAHPAPPPRLLHAPPPRPPSHPLTPTALKTRHPDTGPAASPASTTSAPPPWTPPTISSLARSARAAPPAARAGRRGARRSRADLPRRFRARWRWAKTACVGGWGLACQVGWVGSGWGGVGDEGCRGVGRVDS
jgi:hypothetical protein